MPSQQQDEAPFWGIIEESQNHSGRYSDNSLVCFPASTASGKILIALGVGSEGFTTDLSPSTSPYWHRRFQNLILSEKDLLKEISNADRKAYYGDPLPYKNVNPIPEENFYVKNNFQDITTPLPATFLQPLDAYAQSIYDKYGQVLLAAVWLDFVNAPGPSLQVMKQWVATYCDIRGIITTQTARSKYNTILRNTGAASQDIQQDVQNLLDQRRFVVLQGAPGVGKTYTAIQISNSINYQKTFFTQFHAATSYSEFVAGIQPLLHSASSANDTPTSNSLQFHEVKGTLAEAIEYAASHPEEKVLLIIDEINRANLSNVLGPVFYLFEPNAQTPNFTIQIGRQKYNKLPDNLHVLATMNTADRSLAVVDFALRRRFAWYTITPQAYKAPQGRQFMDKDFREMADIFQKYATDLELDLQPGPSYFDVDVADPDSFRKKLQYELMPLIKEYLEQGYMTAARTELANYFLAHDLIMDR